MFLEGFADREGQVKIVDLDTAKGKLAILVTPGTPLAVYHVNPGNTNIGHG